MPLDFINRGEINDTCSLRVYCPSSRLLISFIGLCTATHYHSYTHHFPTFQLDPAAAAAPLCARKMVTDSLSIVSIVHMEVAVCVGAVRFHVDAVLMSETSLLFSRALESILDSDTSSGGQLALDLTGALHRTEHLSLFLRFCRNQSMRLSTPEAMDVLLIADEWQCPKLVSQLLHLVLETATPQEIFSYISVESVAGPAPPLVALLAHNFERLLSHPSFADLDPSLVAAALAHPECRRPSRNDHARLAVSLVQRHGFDALPVVASLNLLYVDLELLTELQRELKAIGAELFYPDLPLVIELKDKEAKLMSAILNRK